MRSSIVPILYSLWYICVLSNWHQMKRPRLFSWFKSNWCSETFFSSLENCQLGFEFTQSLTVTEPYSQTFYVVSSKGHFLRLDWIVQIRLFPYLKVPFLYDRPAKAAQKNVGKKVLKTSTSFRQRHVLKKSWNCLKSFFVRILLRTIAIKNAPRTYKLLLELEF